MLSYRKVAIVQPAMFRQTQTLFALLPVNILDDILNSGGFDNEVKTYFSSKVLPQITLKMKTKDYFRENVMGKIDETICFLSNDDCFHCFRNQTLLNMKVKHATKYRVCLLCKRVRSGEMAVSAHSASQQWQSESKVLDIHGVSVWKQSQLIRTPNGQNHIGMEFAHPIDVIATVPVSGLVPRTARKVADKVFCTKSRTS